MFDLAGDPNLNYMYDSGLYNSLMKSYTENIPCVDGYFWWQLFYGTGNPEFHDACFRFADNK